MNPNSDAGIGDRARPGRSEPRPRGSPCCVTKFRRVAVFDDVEFGAVAHRTAAGAAALPISISEFVAKRPSKKFRGSIANF